MSSIPLLRDSFHLTQNNIVFFPHSLRHKITDVIVVLDLIIYNIVRSYLLSKISFQILNQNAQKIPIYRVSHTL